MTTHRYEKVEVFRFGQDFGGTLGAYCICGGWFIEAEHTLTENEDPVFYEMDVDLCERGFFDHLRATRQDRA